MSSSEPRPATDLVGRDEERERVRTLLDRSPLVTLTGPGGIGKTTLAKAVLSDLAAAEPATGTWFIDCSALGDERAVPGLAAAALGLVAADSEGADEALLSYLGGRRTVLVLDNVEQLRGLGHRLQRWLEAAPGLALLVTSRLPLRIPHETDHPVPGLGLPRTDDAAEVEASDSGILYLRRARAIGALESLSRDAARDLAAVLRRLDGIPLALELAAGRARILPPGALLRWLDDPTVVASRVELEGAEARHVSLAQVIAMTVAQLPEAERRLLAALAVCPGSFDIDLAAALAPDVAVMPALDLLVSGGLVRAEGEVAGEPRFRLLATIRAQVDDELSPPDREQARERHARAVVAAVRDLAAAWAADEHAGQVRFVAEDDNIAAAVDWLLSHDPSMGLSLLADYDRVAQGGVQLERSVGWYRAMLAAAPAEHPLRGVVTSSLLRLLSRYAGLAEALALEPEVLAAVDRLERPARRRVYLRIAHAHHAAGDAVRTAHYNTLASEFADDPDDAAALRLQAQALLAAARDGDPARAAELLGQGAAANGRAGRIGNQGTLLFKQALAELRLGRTESAIEHARQAVLRCPAGNVRAIAGDVLAMALAEGGDAEGARGALAAAWPEVEREGLIDRLETLEAAVAVLAVHGQDAAAVTALALAERLRPRTGWAREDYVDFLLDRWRKVVTRRLDPVATHLAISAAETAILERLVGEALAPSRPQSVAPAPGQVARPLDGLTRREVEVLSLVGQGRSDGEIAQALFISPKTASVHVANIKGKLGLASRLEIALRARELGLAGAGGAPEHIH